jgi:hypothetical protein
MGTSVDVPKQESGNEGDRASNRRRPCPFCLIPTIELILKIDTIGTDTFSQVDTPDQTVRARKIEHRPDRENTGNREMQSTERNWTVLARIPDLNAGSDAAADEETFMGLPASTGRLIKQALSFKLLIGTALFLLVAAVMPFVFGKKAPSADPSPVIDSAAAWHSGSNPALAERLPAGKMSATPAASSRPVAVIPATSERVKPPATVPPLPDKRAPPQPRSANGPLWSNWPNPAHATAKPAGGEAPRADATQPATVRPSEYEADRNNHDRTRSSVH